MEAHDTLYLSDDTLLRTHTSPVQVRTLQTYTPPDAGALPGQRVPSRFLRCDACAEFHADRGAVHR
jgi:phenylalanyl-tRNA synthetase alpha subunit